MKDNIIEFFTYENYEGMISTPYPAYKNIPKWFADTPILSKKSKCPFKFVNNNLLEIGKKTNVNGCPGLIDYFSTGYIVPSWNNFLIRNDNGKLYINWEHVMCENYMLHATENQASGLLGENEPMYKGFHKISTPWYIKTSPGVSCLITHPMWHRENRFTTASGIIHTDKVPMPLKWFFEWNININNDMTLDNIKKEQIIEKEAPLILIIPFVRKKFNMKINYISENEMDRFLKPKTSYFNHDWLGNSKYNDFRRYIGKLFK